jgi:diacylglycerol kinase family enzyme
MLIILNIAAGTAAREADKIRAKVRDAFSAAGADPEIVSPSDSENISALAQRIHGERHDVVVAGGGDGTISAVAAEVANSGKTLGVLPLGTLNHFAKDIGIPLELEAAVRTIVDGRVIRVDAAEVNGKVFINNSSLGIYPHIVARREAQQERLARGKWPAFFWATLHAFRRFPFLSLQITTESEQLKRRTAFLFVGNNEYEIAGFKLGGRRRLDGGKLGLYLTHRTGRLGLFRLALRALFGRLNQAKDFDAFRVDEAFIESRKPRLLVATDGEVGWMQTPLHYKSRPGALRVLVPREKAA